MYKAYVFIITLANLRWYSALRVCKTFPDYYDVVFNKGCYDNPYSEWSQVEIISSWGFTAEEYTVETEDGYLINVVRGYRLITKKNPVLLGHGFAYNAYSWLGKGNTSLAYLLGEAGFDVWLVNWRGTKQRRGYKTLRENQKEYWEFSFDEMGKYDLPAVLNKITDITQIQKTIYIGFSMGCTIGFIFNTEHPQMAKQKLERMITIAPALYMLDVRSAAQLLTPLFPLLKWNPFVNWHGELFPELSIRLIRHLCSHTPATLIICELTKSTLVGFNFEQLDVVSSSILCPEFSDMCMPEGNYLIGLSSNERIGIFDAIYFASISFRSAVHFGQYMTKKWFAAYDFGKKGNLEKYGSETPKMYNLSDVQVPVTIYVGPNDFFVSIKAGQKIHHELPPQCQCGFHVVPDKKFTHYSVTEAKNAQIVSMESKYSPRFQVLYPSVIDAANSGPASKCRVV